MDVEQTITRFIVDELMLGDSGVQVNPDTPLVSSRILDSLAVLQLVTFLEESFGISIEDDELVAQNFDSVSHMAAMVAAKQPG